MIRGIVAQVVLVALMLVSMCMFVCVNMRYRIGPYLKWLNIVLFVITIYGLALFFSGFALYPNELNIGTSLQFGYLQRYYTSILPIYVFYYFTIEGLLTEKSMRYVFLIFLVSSILMYYQNYFDVSQQIEKEEITNNMGYRFVPLIPMLALIKIKDVWKYTFLTVIFVFIMMSMKRGAILVGTIAFLLYLKNHLMAKSMKQILYVVLLSVIVVSLISIFVINLYETSDYFKSRLSSTMEGNASARNWMYPRYIDFYIHHTSPMEFFFGCGANATYLELGDYAHNDWLEFAVNQGVLGVMLCFAYWISFVREWNSFRGNAAWKQVFGCMLIILFLQSLFSMSLDGMSTATTLCLGYCMAQSEKAKEKHLFNRLRHLIRK